MICVMLLLIRSDLKYIYYFNVSKLTFGAILQ